MPKIHIEHPHSLETADVHKKMDEALKGLAAKHDIKITWKDERNVNLKSSGLKGNAEIKDSSVVVDLDLSFVLAPLKGKIEERLRSKLAKELG